MTQRKDGSGCDFPQGIIGLIVTLERQRCQWRGGDLLPFSESWSTFVVYTSHNTHNNNNNSKAVRAVCRPPFQSPPTPLRAESAPLENCHGRNLKALIATELSVRRGFFCLPIG